MRCFDYSEGLARTETAANLQRYERKNGNRCCYHHTEILERPQRPTRIPTSRSSANSFGKGGFYLNYIYKILVFWAYSPRVFLNYIMVSFIVLNLLNLFYYVCLHLSLR